MDKTTERKLVDTIFGEHYGEGLPELPRGLTYEIDKTNVITDVMHYEYDLAGNRWIVIPDYDLEYNGKQSDTP